MSATDEAIAAMAHAACTQPGACELCQENATKQIDAIPADVLARLAVERGGLEQAPGYHDVICPLFIWEHDPDLFDEQPGSCDCVPVYRINEDGSPKKPLTGAQAAAARKRGQRTYLCPWCDKTHAGGAS